VWLGLPLVDQGHKGLVQRGLNPRSLMNATFAAQFPHTGYNFFGVYPRWRSSQRECDASTADDLLDR
jgi:hypothetical protein